MKHITFFVFLFILSQVVSCSATQGDRLELGRFTKAELSQIIEQSSKYHTNSEKIDFISSKFLGVPYAPSTLIGDNKTKEVLTIDLSGVDCFTYLDYVDAMRMSADHSEFRNKLIKIRYKGEKVSYNSRKHFFSDWISFDKDRVKDVTRKVGGKYAVPVLKYLNKKEDGTHYLSGIPVVERQIVYIPSHNINRAVMSKLMTGDYVGVYSHKDGLDVSHVGILIRKGNKLYFRHASSRRNNQRVLDEELLRYLQGKLGIVVYRPL